MCTLWLQYKIFFIPMKSIKQSFIVSGSAGMVSGATDQTTNVILEAHFDGDAGEANQADYHGC